MTPHVEVTVGRRAQRDIQRILRESALRWGEDQATSYSAAIDGTMERIATHPGIGSEQPMLANVRGLVVEQYLVLYRVNRRRVRIARVVHQRMNLESVKLR